MLDTNSDRSFFVAGIMVILAALIAGLVLVIGLVIPDNMKDESISNIVKVLMFLAVLIVIVILVCIAFVAFVRLSRYRKSIKHKRIIQQNKTLFSDRSGYVAYCYLNITCDLIQDRYDDMLNDKTSPMFDTFKKLDEIRNVYNGNRDKYDIVMYKHEHGFKVMEETLHEAYENNMTQNTVIINALHEMVEYPHNDIVGDGIANKIIEPLQKEITMQKSLNKLYSKD